MKGRMKTWLGGMLLGCMVAWNAGADPVQAVGTNDHAQQYTKTRYPIVLVHGMMGFDSILGILDYWSNIPKALEKGGAKVYVTEMTQLANDKVRGEELIRQLEDLQARYGYTKFNLIGHSQGGTTSRYVAAVRPDLVASVTTVGTPHDGSKVADGLLGLLPEGTLRRGLVVDFLNTQGQLISLLSSGRLRKEDTVQAANALSTRGERQFSALYPEGAPITACGSGPELASNGIHYYSFGGTRPLTNALDPTDIVTGLGSLFFAGADNDGLVGRCSSHWGKVIRDDYPWNHLDEVNQLFGLRMAFSPEPAEVYRTQVNRLKNLDL